MRTNDTPRSRTILLARVHEQLYVLAFTNAPKATACARALGAEGQPFYVCGPNIESVIREARGVGGCGFIIDYDVALTRFTAAHSLPREASPDPR